MAKDAKVLQGDITPTDRPTKKVDVAIQGDAEKGRGAACWQLSGRAGRQGPRERRDLIAETKSLEAGLSSMEHEDDDPGPTGNQRARERNPPHEPAAVWRALMAARQQARMSTTSATTAHRHKPTRASRRAQIRRRGSSALRLGCRDPWRRSAQDMPVIGFAGYGAFGIS